jgi:hypothetical protein
MTDPRPTPSAEASDAAAALAALVARIEASSIEAGGSFASSPPPGYDETDIRILEWIASHRHGRRRARPAELAA